MIWGGGRIAAMFFMVVLGAGCQPLSYGEVLVVADTDVAVPDQTVPGCHEVYSGAAAVTITITQPDQYHFEVVRSTPDGSRGDVGGNTVLWLRQYCPDGPQLACNDDLDAANHNQLSGFD